jgi:amino-acid N-acetyltransferase
LKLRKAELRDVPALFKMIGHYATERILLPRTQTDLYEHVWEFTVAEENGRVLACGALRIYNDQFAEIRSLCVEPGQETRGLGGALTDRLLAEARRLGLKTVFALTVTPGFFGKLGFREVSRETLPMKVWRDCLQCEKYFHCDEKAMILDLSRRQTSRVASCPQAAEVSA